MATTCTTIESGSVVIAGQTFSAEVVNYGGGQPNALLLTGAGGGGKFLVPATGALRPNTYIIRSFAAAGDMRDKFSRTVRVCWDGRTLAGLIEVTTS